MTWYQSQVFLRPFLNGLLPSTPTLQTLFPKADIADTFQTLLQTLLPPPRRLPNPLPSSQASSKPPPSFITLLFPKADIADTFQTLRRYRETFFPNLPPPPSSMTLLFLKADTVDTFQTLHRHREILLPNSPPRHLPNPPPSSPVSLTGLVVPSPASSPHRLGGIVSFLGGGIVFLAASSSRGVSSHGVSSHGGVSSRSVFLCSIFLCSVFRGGGIVSSASNPSSCHCLPHGVFLGGIVFRGISSLQHLLPWSGSL